MNDYEQGYQDGLATAKLGDTGGGFFGLKSENYKRGFLDALNQTQQDVTATYGQMTYESRMYRPDEITIIARDKDRP